MRIIHWESLHIIKNLAILLLSLDRAVIADKEPLPRSFDLDELSMIGLLYLKDFKVLVFTSP